eukprot:gene4178-8313_t
MSGDNDNDNDNDATTTNGSMLHVPGIYGIQHSFSESSDDGSSNNVRPFARRLSSKSSNTSSKNNYNNNNNNNTSSISGSYKRSSGRVAVITTSNVNSEDNYYDSMSTRIANVPTFDTGVWEGVGGDEIVSMAVQSAISRVGAQWVGGDNGIGREGDLKLPTIRSHGLRVDVDEMKN